MVSPYRSIDPSQRDLFEEFRVLASLSDFARVGRFRMEDGSEEMLAFVGEIVLPARIMTSIIALAVRTDYNLTQRWIDDANRQIALWHHALKLAGLPPSLHAVVSLLRASLLKSKDPAVSNGAALASVLAAYEGELAGASAF